jgi:raffinose/stachyose/melibiose transport system permease protein
MTSITHTRRRPRDGSYWTYFLPGAVLFTVVIAIPFVYNIYLSLTRWSGVGKPRFAGLHQYTKLFGDDVFWTSFRNSLSMIVAMVVIPTIIGLVLAAVLFDVLGKRFGSRVVSVLRATFYLPQVLPVVVAGIVWGWILRPDGALNGILDSVGLGSLSQDWLGDPSFAMPSVMLVMVWVQIGYPVVIFMAALARVDPELYEAAELDGASLWRRIWHVTIPQTRLILSLMLLLQIIATMQQFTEVYLLTGGDGPQGSTTTVVYLMYQYAFNFNNLGSAAALGVIMLLVLIGFSALYARLSRARD